MNRPDSRAKNMPKIAELKLPSCGLQNKLRLQNCRVVVAEQHFFKKLPNCDCGSASFKLRNCDCGLKKKLCVPTLSLKLFHVLLLHMYLCVSELFLQLFLQLFSLGWAGLDSRQLVLKLLHIAASYSENLTFHQLPDFCYCLHRPHQNIFIS